MRFEADLQRELQVISDRLVYARSELTRMETLLAQKFIYAQNSGRIQRMGVTKPGSRIAAGARIMEVAPLETDFELVANTTRIEVPDLRNGQIVQVMISSGLKKSVWVPARISSILELSQNRRRVVIHIDRSDLTKRDLLRGDRTLNGLGESSNALVSVNAQPAMVGLRSTISNVVRPKIENLSLGNAEL